MIRSGFSVSTPSRSGRESRLRLVFSSIGVRLAPVFMTSLLVVAGLAVGSSLALAEPETRKVAGEELGWTPPALPECTCRAQGKTFQLGQQVCLSTPDGFRLAQCELTQNVTNWRFSSNDCVTSQRSKSGVADRHLAEACFANGDRRI